MSALPSRHILSKSTFVRGCQCEKSLWLYKHHYNKRDLPDARQIQIFEQGTNVGLLARQLFANGVDASPSDVFQYRQSVRDTARYIAQGYSVIFEAAFQYEGILCAVDILLKHKGKWYAYEVKSATEVKPQFETDAALQYYVISNAGLELEDFFLVYINRSYIRNGALQLKELFTKQSVKEKVVGMQPEIAHRSDVLLKVVSQQYMPAIDVGEHCTKPYICDFYSFCHQQPVEADVASSQLCRKGEVTRTVTVPEMYLDIQTYRVAVPEYDGHWPYMYIPYQYLYVNKQDEAQKLHHFIADYTGDPIQQFLQSFIQLAQSDKPIYVVDKPFVLKIIHQFIDRNMIYRDDLIRILNLIETLTNVESSFATTVPATQDKEDNLITDDESARQYWMQQRRLQQTAGTLSNEPLKAYAAKKYLHYFHLQ